MHRSGLPCLAVLLAFFVPLPSARAGSPQRQHDITVDDYFTQADLFQAVIAPDGKHVAYTEGRWQQSTDDRKTDLWVVECQTARVRRLTFDRANDRAPAWTPDGQTAYFLGNRKREGEKQPPYNGKTQVWRVPAAGGEPLAVTRAEDGVGLFELARDGRALYYTTQTDHADEEWKELRQRFKDVEYGHGAAKVSQVWRLDLDNWRAEKVVDDRRYVHDLAVSPDGRRLAMITAPDDRVISFEGQSRVDVFDREDKKVTPLPDRLFRAEAPSPYGWLEKLAWSGTGRSLAFNVVFDGYPAEIIVAEWAEGSPTLFRLKRPEGLSVRGYGSPLQWRGDGPELCFLGEQKARVRLYCAAGLGPGKQPELRPLTPEHEVVDAFSLTGPGDQAAVIMNGTTHLPDIFLVKSGDEPRRLTRVNPQADSWKLPKISTVSWRGANGDPVEGVLELPPDYQPGKRLPLVVEIHGGPTTATYCKLQYWIYGRTLLPARGYALLSPNYRGSTGYGDKFLTDLVGRENDIEVEDILKGVDALVERGIADPERLGVMGWSNGGYLTNCLISKSTRFKAASSGAGIVDAVMEFGANDEPAYSLALKRGFPWDRPDNYHRASPTYQLNKVRTPTLIHVGGKDERCPPVHSRMLYRALKEYVRVPTELLVYPGAEHGLMKYKHRKAKMEWDLAWFDRYLLGKPAKGTPLKE
jgi:dipeptidyl aminopeptidase/acylaminoacyl peptidase